MLRVEKLAAATAYILQKNGGRLDYTKLIKLIYLLDREEFNSLGHSMSGDEFRAFPKGPVPIGLYSLIKGEGEREAQALWDSRFLTCGHDIAARAPGLPTGWLSRFEKRVLDELDAKFHNASCGDLIEYTHAACPEWKDPSPAASRKIAPAEILAALGCSKREIELIEAENEAYEREQAIIAGVRGG